jgi:hypothetical protein
MDADADVDDMMGDVWELDDSSGEAFQELAIQDSSNQQPTGVPPGATSRAGEEGA